MAQKTGRFGTVFLTTHLLSRVTNIKGILEAADKSFYEFEFVLDRLGKMSPDFVLSAYQAGNGECTVDFVKKLLERNKFAKLLLIWDGAIYHRGQDMQEFLAQHNDGLSPDEWRVTCELFPAYAPEENPVEAIWLQLKSLLRRFYRFGNNFNIVKRLFQLFADLKLFSFPNLERYQAFSQFI